MALPRVAFSAVRHRFAPLLALFALAGCASPTQRPLLWVIAGPRPSYIYGTIHLPDARVTALPGVVQTALRDSDAFFAELELTGDVNKRVDQQSKLPPGSQLQDVLPPELYDRAASYFRSRGIDLGRFADRKIWFVAMTAELLDDLGAFVWHQPLDQKLWNMASGWHKRLGGLETAEEQLGLFEDLSESEQAAMLAVTLDKIEEAHQRGTTAARELVEIYLRGDELELQQAIEAGAELEQSELTRKLYARFITERNARMAERIAAQLRAHPDTACFFAVGAGHVVGDDGVIARLRAAGFTAQRVGRDEAVRQPAEPTRTRSTGDDRSPNAGA